MIKERQAKLVKEFSEIEDWEDRYKKVIAKGKELPDLDVSLKVDDLLVRGCQSQVWLHGELDSEGRVVFRGESDAMIVRGLVALLLFVYSGSTPDEILTTSPTFIKDLGFETNLTPSRTNGLYSMVKQMQFYAMAFKAKQGKA